ncbi:MAG: hypothetical protein M0P69_06515 [Bacteroidales bacterium]|jgi:hypothetical protein|nr:hypothetical protein [Bacteroidales bacterium]MDD2812913.1 hypothetical protein [Bacteroidales bacterium]MDD3385095.1 hypothetical protein [Bacteroidales bacterium]MDD3812538.1 hypothetical protein [Bacteroidales bacterium]MDD3871554.1 hypothetical protein [Bacteroidales bacterium]
MNEQLKSTEKMFWITIFKMVEDYGYKPEWESMGRRIDLRALDSLITGFHEDPDQAGFYGIRIPIVQYEGLNINLLIENQKELVLGVQTEEVEGAVCACSFEWLTALLEDLSQSRSSWNFEAPGWLAWKTTNIRLNFRRRGNLAFQDMIRKRANSEALYLISGEISDILDELAGVAEKEREEAYGALAV